MNSGMGTIDGFRKFGICQESHVCEIQHVKNLTIEGVKNTINENQLNSRLPRHRGDRESLECGRIHRWCHT